MANNKEQIEDPIHLTFTLKDICKHDINDTKVIGGTLKSSTNYDYTDYNGNNIKYSKIDEGTFVSSSVDLSKTIDVTFQCPGISEFSGRANNLVDVSLEYTNLEREKSMNKISYDCTIDCDEYKYNDYTGFDKTQFSLSYTSWLNNPEKSIFKIGPASVETAYLLSRCGNSNERGFKVERISGQDLFTYFIIDKERGNALNWNILKGLEEINDEILKNTETKENNQYIIFFPNKICLDDYGKAYKNHKGIVYDQSESFFIKNIKGEFIESLNFNYEPPKIIGLSTSGPGETDYYKTKIYTKDGNFSSSYINFPLTIMDFDNYIPVCRGDKFTIEIIYNHKLLNNNEISFKYLDDSNFKYLIDFQKGINCEDIIRSESNNITTKTIKNIDYSSLLTSNIRPILEKNLIFEPKFEYHKYSLNIKCYNLDDLNSIMFNNSFKGVYIVFENSKPGWTQTQLYKEWNAGFGTSASQPDHSVIPGNDSEGYYLMNNSIPFYYFDRFHFEFRKPNSYDEYDEYEIAYITYNSHSGIQRFEDPQKFVFYANEILENITSNNINLYIRKKRYRIEISCNIDDNRTCIMLENPNLANPILLTNNSQTPKKFIIDDPDIEYIISGIDHDNDNIRLEKLKEFDTISNGLEDWKDLKTTDNKFYFIPSDKPDKYLRRFKAFYSTIENSVTFSTNISCVSLYLKVNDIYQSFVNNSENGSENPSILINFEDSCKYEATAIISSLNKPKYRFLGFFNNDMQLNDLDNFSIEELPGYTKYELKNSLGDTNGNYEIEAKFLELFAVNFDVKNSCVKKITVLSDELILYQRLDNGNIIKNTYYGTGEIKFRIYLNSDEDILEIQSDKEGEISFDLDNITEKDSELYYDISVNIERENITITISKIPSFLSYYNPIYDVYEFSPLKEENMAQLESPDLKFGEQKIILKEDFENNKKSGIIKVADLRKENNKYLLELIFNQKSSHKFYYLLTDTNIESIDRYIEFNNELSESDNSQFSSEIDSDLFNDLENNSYLYFNLQYWRQEYNVYVSFTINNENPKNDKDINFITYFENKYTQHIKLENLRDCGNVQINSSGRPGVRLDLSTGSLCWINNFKFSNESFDQNNGVYIYSNGTEPTDSGPKTAPLIKKEDFNKNISIITKNEFGNPIDENIVKSEIDHIEYKGIKYRIGEHKTEDNSFLTIIVKPDGVTFQYINSSSGITDHPHLD